MWKSISEDMESPRNELLYNIDDIYKYAALRQGDWKYVTGSTTKGLRDGWYGSSGKSDFYHYDADAVLKSETGSVLAGLLTYKQIQEKNMDGNALENDTNFTVHLLSPEKITNLRDQAQIKCGTAKSSPATRCDAFRSPCLFNLVDDPCERINLAASNPSLVSNMEKTIDEYRQTAVKPRNVPRDPNADPARFNNTWTNWQDWEDVQRQKIAHKMLSPLSIGLISAACLAFVVVVALLIGIKVKNSKKTSRPVSMFEDPLDHQSVAMGGKAQIFEERELSMRSSFKDALKSVE